jgi:hypothetical protein
VINDVAVEKNSAPQDLRARLGVWDISRANIDDDMSLDIAEEMLMKYSLGFLTLYL